MNVLIKSAKIIDPKSDFNNEIRDILVENGVISKIAKRIPNPGRCKEIKLTDLHISQGWFDSSVSFGEPGFEERETIKNGLNTAARSGFTAVVVNSNTQPTAQTGSDIAFLLSRAEGHAVRLLPVGSLSINNQGESLAELFDMSQAGAVSFYDYQIALNDPNFMKVALQYASTFDGLVSSFPLDDKIARQGVVHEGVVSTMLGLSGIPSLAEELRVKRDLSLLEYTGGKLHIPTISTLGSVELIKDAKARRLDVSCSAAIHNLIFIDEHLKHFNSNFKVLPPLRSEIDRLALIDGLKDGTIDMVTSDHNPLDIESKKLEFEYAKFGTIGLESAFGALLNVFTLKTTIKLLTRGRERFSVESTSMNIGNRIDATLFTPNTKVVFSKDQIHSKSKNSIFLNKELSGHVYGIINQDQMVLETH
ncbi:MAG: dihydroorotase [Flavobacteriaceae bacterium]|nr:dihydroorotase [Flavobacteriaceae bacterium]